MVHFFGIFCKLSQVGDTISVREGHSLFMNLIGVICDYNQHNNTQRLWSKRWSVGPLLSLVFHNEAFCFYHECRSVRLC